MLRTPLWGIYCLLPFILLRDMGANAWQVALMIGIKPAVSLFSFYWSAGLEERPDRLVSNIIWASVLGSLPFLLFPFVNSVGYFIFAYGAYMLFHRGMIPAWMELIKRKSSKEKTFAWANLLGYLGDAVFPFLFGPLCDTYEGAWRWIFFAAALLSIGAVFWQLRIPLQKLEGFALPKPGAIFTKPWKDAWHLMKARADFRHFQMGFMLGGSGLMVMHATLPYYMMDVLEISYTELAIALTFCKGVGVGLSSHFWAAKLQRTSIFPFCAAVTALAAIFPVFLFAAKWQLSSLFAAYLIYGVMQAGSETAWNLSGPIFAPNEDSSRYSGVNVLTVGIRGVAAPAIATLLFQMAGSGSVLFLGGSLCLAATGWMLLYTARDVKVV